MTETSISKVQGILRSISKLLFSSFGCGSRDGNANVRSLGNPSIYIVASLFQLRPCQSLQGSQKAPLRPPRPPAPCPKSQFTPSEPPPPCQRPVTRSSSLLANQSASSPRHVAWCLARLIRPKSCVTHRKRAVSSSEYPPLKSICNTVFGIPLPYSPPGGSPKP